MIALPPYANVNIYARRIACYTENKREHVVDVVVDVVAVTVAAAAATVIVVRKVGRLSRMCSPFILSVSSLVQSKLVFVRLTYPLSCVLHCNRSLCVPLCSLWVFLCCFFSGVLQMDGNKSAKAYFNTCNRDISSNGCACSDGM